MAVLDSQGVVFTIADSGGTPITVGEITSFSGLDGQASDIDITTLASTAKEFRQGLQDFGGFTLELKRDPQDPGQAELDAARAAQATRQCTLTVRTGQVATFTAYVKSLSVKGAVDSVIDGTCTMKVTGVVVWTD